MIITIEEALAIHACFVISEPDTRIDCANQALRVMGASADQVCTTYKEAVEILRSLLHAILDDEDYMTAALLCWGITLFDPRPKSVRLIWKGLMNYARLLIYGAGSMGKSYTTIVFGLLDWERDPEFTTTKLVSTTAGHERAQTFSNLVRLHRMSAVPLSGYIKQGFIGLDKDDKRSSIAEVAIPPGEDGKGRLQGFHPLPRPYPHPKFGTLTRVRGIFDEAEDTAVGLWKGEANMMQNMDDEMHVAIAAMWNPKRRDAPTAIKAEPVGGYENLDERLDEYTSKENYHCIRLDARKCENVIEKRNVFPGLQTYQGFMTLVERGGADADTFAYGLYPKEIASFQIISPMSLNGRRGRFIWERHPTPIGTLDMAEEGEDQAIYTAQEYGLAIGYQPEGKQQIIFDRSRWCLQVEQQFAIPKQNTILMGMNVIRISRDLDVRPEWFALDCTNSVTLRDWLTLKWGPVLGIKWGEAATDIPILEEEKEKASDLFTNVKTEMWFATGSWCEFGYMAFSPSMETSTVFNQLVGMRYVRVSKTMKRCEETKVYKKRFAGKSPDEASSCIMGVHIVRQRSGWVAQPAMDPNAPRPAELMPPPEGILESSETSECIDSIEYV